VKTMTKPVSSNLLIVTPMALTQRVAAAAALGLALAAQGQVQLTAPPTSSLGWNPPLIVLPGSNVSTTGAVSGNTITSTFTGDAIASFGTDTAPGTYSGTFNANSILPFSVGALPVRIGQASLEANFKLVASGGNGVADGNDPVINLRMVSRLYQQVGETTSLFFDPWLSSIEYRETFTHNGNGLQVIDGTFGPKTADFILTPGNYFLYQELYVTAAYTSVGSKQPIRGFAIEFGGELSGYSGLKYSVEWETVPTPGSAVLAGLAGVVGARRRRR
jgi:hypothetical protein